MLTFFVVLLCLIASFLIVQLVEQIATGKIAMMFFIIFSYILIALVYVSVVTNKQLPLKVVHFMTRKRMK